MHFWQESGKMDFMLIKPQSLNYTSIIPKLHNCTKPPGLPCGFVSVGGRGEKVETNGGASAAPLLSRSSLRRTELWLHVRRAPPHRGGRCHCASVSVKSTQTKAAGSYLAKAESVSFHHWTSINIPTVWACWTQPASPTECSCCPTGSPGYCMSVVSWHQSTAADCHAVRVMRCVWRHQLIRSFEMFHAFYPITFQRLFFKCNVIFGLFNGWICEINSQSCQKTFPIF